MIEDMHCRTLDLKMHGIADGMLRRPIAGHEERRAFDIQFDSAPTMEKPIRVRIAEKWHYTFDKPGVYKYTCKVHRNYDMKGVIIVE